MKEYYHIRVFFIKIIYEHIFSYSQLFREQSNLVFLIKFAKNKKFKNCNK